MTALPPDLVAESDARLAYCEVDRISGNKYVVVFFSVLSDAAKARELGEYLGNVAKWLEEK